MWVAIFIGKWLLEDKWLVKDCALFERSNELFTGDNAMQSATTDLTYFKIQKSWWIMEDFDHSASPPRSHSIGNEVMKPRWDLKNKGLKLLNDCRLQLRSWVYHGRLFLTLSSMASDVKSDFVISIYHYCSTSKIVDGVYILWVPFAKLFERYIIINVAKMRIAELLYPVILEPNCRTQRCLKTMLILSNRVQSTISFTPPEHF